MEGAGAEAWPLRALSKEDLGLGSVEDSVEREPKRVWRGSREEDFAGTVMG